MQINWRIPAIKNWILIVFCCWAFSGHGSVITWTNVAGGNWSNPQNWNPNQVPSTNDVALITTGGTYTVVVDPYSVSVSNLTVGAGAATAGVQTLLSTNLPDNYHYYVTVQININGQLLVTNGGAIFLTGSPYPYLYFGPSKTLSAGNVLVDQGGNLTCSNLLVEGDMQIQNGGVLNFYYSSVGAQYIVSTVSNATVINGGIVNASQGVQEEGTDAYYELATFNGPLILTNGGTLNVIDAVTCNAPLAIDSGGIVNIGPARVLVAYEIVTNSGTINLTNGTFWLIGYATTTIGEPEFFYELGNLYNLAGGLINLQGQSAIRGADDWYSPYPQTNGFWGTVINAGVIVASGTNTINTTFLDNSDGTITNFSGQLDLSLLPPTPSTTFDGEFFCEEGATMNLKNVYSVSNLVGAPNLLFSATPIVSDGLIFKGGGGTAWGTYVVLQSTNPRAPLPSWTPIATNAFDGEGGFVFTNVPVAGSPGNFFIFKEH